MIKFTIEIHTDGPAFHLDEMAEVTRILEEEVLEKISSTALSSITDIRDSEGEICGTIRIDE